MQDAEWEWKSPQQLAAFEPAKDTERLNFLIAHSASIACNKDSYTITWTGASTSQDGEECYVEATDARAAIDTAIATETKQFSRKPQNIALELTESRKDTARLDFLDTLDIGTILLSGGRRLGVWGKPVRGAIDLAQQQLTAIAQKGAQQ